MTDALTAAVCAVMHDAAARAIMPRFTRLTPGEIIEKAKNDLVTVADREAEDILRDGLARLLPEAAIVGEEATHADPALKDRLGDPLCWIIDPIDGTGNFAAGRAPFGVLVALAEHGVAVGGWIYDPLTGRLCHALARQGAFIAGEPIVARSSGETPPIAAISTLFARPARRAAIAAHIAPHYRLVEIPRCAAEQYPRLALGINDVSIFERTLAWDHGAGALFLNEAGGKCARTDGSAYRVDDDRRGLVAAASPALWDQLATLLAGTD